MNVATDQPTRTPAAVSGPVRRGRPTTSLLKRLRSGDVAVIDHEDLDRETAQSLVDAGVVAVVNVQPFSSGRYPNQGPAVLAAAGIALVENIGSAGWAALVDGHSVRVHDGAVREGEGVVAQGRGLDARDVRLALSAARAGMLAQLDTFTHNSSELLRREHDLLLSGEGLPMLATRTSGRPVLVVGPSVADKSALRRLKAYLREERPAVLAVGEAAEWLRKAGVRADVVVVDGSAELPPAKVLRAAHDVVVVQGSASDRASSESLSRLGVTPLPVATSLDPEDVALLVADAAGPRLVVAWGLTLELSDFLDRRRPGLAGSYLARLALGGRLVDASAVSTLYTGRVRPWHLLLLVLAGLVAVAAAIATTPVGRDWADSLGPALTDAWDRIRTTVEEWL